LSPYDNNTQINNFKANFGVTHPCAGYQGGSVAAIDVVIEGQPFYGYPTYLVICPDRNVYFDICWPPTASCFDQYFGECNPELSVSPAVREVSAPKGITTFFITSNADWTITENAPWLDVATLSGTGNKTLKVNFEANASGSTRSAGITISTADGSISEVVVVSQVSYPEHVIDLSVGWNSLSSYILPANKGIVDIFNQVSDGFIIAETTGGVYFPTGLLNTIGEWESQSAYKVKMDAPGTLQIIGEPESNKTLFLSAGWNLIPVICNIPVDAASIFGALDVEMVKDIAGTGIYWPDLDINTLGDLQPGEAYYIYMNTAGSLTFPPNAE